jgi:hypothetical protein
MQYQARLVELPLESKRLFCKIAWVSSRVTRLDDLLPIGRLFTLGSFFEKYRSKRNLGSLFATIKSYALNVGLRLGQIFSQTHLVTLVSRECDSSPTTLL